MSPADLKRVLRRTLAPAITLFILILIYLHIDLGELMGHLSHMDPLYISLALMMFVPQILVSSIRWRWMVKGISSIGLGGSIRVVMASKAMNALLPSKAGEMSKALFMRQEVGLGLEQGVPLVMLEKVLDVAGLSIFLFIGSIMVLREGAEAWVGLILSAGFIAALGVIFRVKLIALGRFLLRISERLSPVSGFLEGWDEAISVWKGHPSTLTLILFLSVLLWSLHLLQIFLFFPALGGVPPIKVVVAYVPLSIFVGLLPVTIGGMGTRDSALIYLFSSYETASLMAGVGLLCSVRYWMDTLLGVPFFYRYSSSANSRGRGDLRRTMGRA